MEIRGDERWLWCRSGVAYKRKPYPDEAQLCLRTPRANEGLKSTFVNEGYGCANLSRYSDFSPQIILDRGVSEITIGEIHQAGFFRDDSVRQALQRSCSGCPYYR